MAYIRFYSPYHSAFRDESANEAYDRLVSRFSEDNHCGCRQSGAPAANISETDKEYVIEMALPGVDKKDISIKHEMGLLHISVNKPEEQQEVDQYKLREFDYTGASRTYKTGEKIDTDNIAAKYENGILRVILPKKETFINKPAQSIEVN